MGIGMVLIINKNNLSKVEAILNDMGEVYHLMGQVVENPGKEKIKIS
jgi:phosphoribosylaminoimidazole (AIR) synthetase